MPVRTRRFGRLGWQVSEVGYGMWGMGGWTGSDDADSARSLDRAVALSFFDTAFVYGMGKSERLLGDMLRRHRGKKLYIATKVPPKNMTWPGRADVAAADAYPYEHILEFTHKSLENLGPLNDDAVDLLQLHVWSDTWATDEAVPGRT